MASKALGRVRGDTDHMSAIQAGQPDLRWMVYLSALTIAARLIFLLVFGGFDNRLVDSLHDQNVYRDVARNLVAGHGFILSIDMWIADAGKPTSIVAPMYPWLVAICFWLFGDNVVPVRLVQILLSLAVVLPIYLIGCRVFDPRVGKIAGVIVALYPALIMYVRPLMSETLSIALLATTTYLTVQLGRSSPPAWLLVLWGGMAGLAVLTRSEALLLMPIILGYIAWHHWRGALGKRLALIAIPLLALGLTLSPYAYYNHVTHGHFSPFPNKKWFVLWDQIWLVEMRQSLEWRDVALPERRIVPDWDDKSEAERDTYLSDLGLQFALSHPGAYAKQRIKQAYWAYPVVPIEIFTVLSGRAHWGSADGADFGPTSLDDRVQYTTLAEQTRVWAFRLIVALAVGGLVLLTKQRRWEMLWLAYVLLWSIGCAMLFASKERYRLQVDPFLILLGAAFIDYLWTRIRSVRYPKRGEHLVPATASG